jgi:hypothetical protein
MHKNLQSWLFNYLVCKDCLLIIAKLLLKNKYSLMHWDKLLKERNSLKTWYWLFLVLLIKN